MWCKHLLTLCLGETLTQNILKGVSASICCLNVCICVRMRAHFYMRVLNGGGRNRLNSSRKKMECVCVCEIQQTAGGLQVQISFPSASLLIKQLNGQKKVVLRVKSVKERGTGTHTNTHSM